MNDSKVFSEMNRGFLQLLVLLVLNEPAYGYDILKLLDSKGYGIEEQTLYPLLRRMEERGFLTSEWKIIQNKPRKYYVISEEGKRIRKELIVIWKNQNKIINEFWGG
ncbi:MAG: PadR family transcriptional regulator, regulatory protein PadR [Kosmotogales bacterium]|nr:PadR family transcriptional regulator, regulatory protein PadR [Kosmotogales bacterium]